MGPDLNRICNIAGYPIYKWAAMQLNVRSKQGQQDIRDDSNLLYLANKGAWVRVLSSVNLERNLMNYYRTINPNIARPQDLAESYVLYGGTSTYAFESNKLNMPQYGINNLEIGDLGNVKGAGMNLRSGLGNNGAYNLLGDQEVKAYGYRPMPGITSVNIEATGRLGSLRQATVNFKVWDKYQLDIIDALYFRPGFTVLIEYGHAKYYDNDSNLQTSEQWMIQDPFNIGTTKEQINILISNGIRRSYGNYGGMLGIVTHFDFSMNTDGGYDCSIRAMSLGAVMGNFPINHLDVFSKAYQGQLKVYLDTTRATKIADARNETQSLQDAAVEKAKSDLQSSKGIWAKLKIDDPFKNLLFNTNNYGYINRLNSVVTKNTTLAPGKAHAPDNFDILTEVNKNTIDYKLTHDISDSKTTDFSKQELITDPQTFIDKYYYIHSQDSQNGINNTPAIYYNEEIHYIQADPSIIVKFDVNKLNSIFLDRGTQGINIVEPQVGNLKLGLTPQYDGNTAFDIIENLRGFSAYPISYQYQQSGLQFLGDNVKQAAFTIAYYYDGDKDKASSVFNNQNSAYRVEYIKSINKTTKNKKYLVNIKLKSIENPDYYIELGAESISSGAVSDSYYYTSDLSLISYSSGDQSLMTNEPYEDYKNAVLAAEKKSAEVIGQKNEQINTDYDADQVALTTESKSTLELMLKSLLLFAINHDNSLSINSPTYAADLKSFIRDIFSEG